MYFILKLIIIMVIFGIFLVISVKSSVIPVFRLNRRLFRYFGSYSGISFGVPDAPKVKQNSGK